MAETENAKNGPEDALLNCHLTSADIRKMFSESGDIIFRDFLINNRADLTVTIAYVDGMVNSKIINDDIICPLSTSDWFEVCTNQDHAFKLCLNGALNISAIEPTQSAKKAVDTMLAGKTLLIFDKLESALILDTIFFEKRGISPATEEETYRSGKDSFVETLRVNTATLRKKIKSHHLILEESVVGKQTNTRVCIAYMANICNDDFIKKVKDAVSNIDQDRAMSIRDIYTHVTSEKYTPFPTAIVSEKPDVCCMSLLEGKVAIIVDELPYSIILPGVFDDLFQSTSDYGYNFMLASFFRIIRYICFLIALVLPGFFIAITTFHVEMIPYKLEATIAASRTGTPFHVYVEMLIMTLAFFILIQATMQISRAVGGTISIVGGLVLGQAAISAGLVSPAVIVVVATSAVCSMAVPNKEANMAVWLFQLICTVLSSILGLIGLVVGMLILIYVLAEMEPLGVPYLSPYVYTDPLQLDDSIVRFPDNLIKRRPLYLEPKNKRRMR